MTIFYVQFIKASIPALVVTRFLYVLYLFGLPWHMTLYGMQA